METRVKPVTDQGFEAEVLTQDKVQLVDFWAEWCGPCKRLAPTLETLAGDFEGLVEIRKLNIEENPETTARYGIQSIPTLLVFRGGQIVDRIVGAVPKEQLERSLSAQLERN